MPEDPRVEEVHLLELLGWRLGVVHDLEAVVGQPEEVAAGWVEKVFGRRVDIALFGHTHVPLTWGLPSGTAILNPGSPTLPHGYRKVLGTVAILELERGSFTFDVIDLATGASQLRIAGPSVAAMKLGPPPSGGV